MKSLEELRDENRVKTLKEWNREKYSFGGMTRMAINKHGYKDITRMKIELCYDATRRIETNTNSEDITRKETRKLVDYEIAIKMEAINFSYGDTTRIDDVSSGYEDTTRIETIKYSYEIAMRIWQL